MKLPRNSWVLPVVIVIALGELSLDILTPLGTADYIFYILPVALTVLQKRPRLPLFTALLTTVLMALGLYLSPHSVLREIAILNRFFTSVTIWIVAIMVKIIITNRNLIEENDWIKSGENDLSIRIRGEMTVEEIGQHIFSFFSDYLNIKAGSLYLFHEGTRKLSFVQGYAFNPQAHSKTFDLGENLVGQVARDKKPKELLDLPEGYLTMSSSLGESRPSSLIVYPLLADNKIVGVLELAFDRKHQKRSFLLLEKLGEPMAISIRSVQNRDRLSQLLNQAQALTEELQSQQEELRVTNEELEQQTKALRESHLKMENQQAELEQSNQQLEEQAQTLENQKLILDERNRALVLSQAALEEKGNEIARSSQYKSEFLANMSHELRTPLNSTLILAKLLADDKPGTLTEEQRKYAEIIYTSGNDLLNLINDILDLSKVEAGKMEAHLEVVDLESIGKHLEALFRAQAITKSLDFKVEISAQAPATIITDRQRLEQILKNFLSNALKFTDKGFVQLQIYLDNQGVSFAVSDSGIGIPQGQQEVIFEAFRQADGTSNRKYGGTGLGLSISKELAHLLQGEIKVKSARGEGSTFILSIPTEFTAKMPIKGKRTGPLVEGDAPPLNAAKGEQTPASLVKFSFNDDRASQSPSKRKLLIIEDDENFAKILFDLAHEMSFAGLVSPTASEGIELAKQHLPHAIILDMRLPDHSGLLVLEQLKTNPRTRHIPVHVISSSDLSQSALQLGASGYMLKPVKREELQSAFTHLSALMNQTEKFVLVVEDDAVQRELIVGLICDAHITVHTALTASEALERLSSKTYDCMIMDLSLPDMSGHDLLTKLSAESERYSYPPVIVYTARDLTRDEEERLRNYSGSIIIKGAKSPERLLSEVTLFLHKVETELPPERQKMLSELRNREKTLEERKILVVDDDVRNIYALTSALENFGAKISTARNGREAIEKIMSIHDLDLVLMDIMMPEMDGYEAMRKLRMNKKFDKLPIIALTAKAMKDDQEKCLEAGANDYLPKPIDVDKLLSLIRVWLPHQRSFYTQ